MNEIDVDQVIDYSRLNKVSLGVIILCGLIMLMDGYDYTIITVAAPEIMKEWNISPGPFGWAFSAAFLGYLFGAIIFGTLSDRIGRKKTLIMASCVFSVGTLLVYFTHALQSLIAIRVFTGVGIGGAVPCAFTLTSEYSPVKGRGKYLSIMFTGFLAGVSFGGLLAGYMMDRFGWRSLFLVGFMAPVISIIISGFILPESARWLSAGNRMVKHKETLIKLMKRIQPHIQIDANTQFISAGTNKKSSSVKELFSGKLAWVTPVVWGLYLVSSLALFFLGSWTPQLLVIKGFSASTAAYITGSLNMFIGIGCLLSGFYFDKVGFRWGSLLYIIAAVCILFTGGLAPAGFVILLFICGFFINSGHMDVTILAPIVYPSGCRNQGAGAAIAAGRIGAIIGPVVGGLLLDTKLPLETLLGVVAIPLVIATVLCYMAGRQYDFYFAPLYAGKILPEKK